MLECWQEEPGKRPTFSKLRARFDNMLLAEKKETYIDLQIDASKPYYNPEFVDEETKQDEGLLKVVKSGKRTSHISTTSPFHIKGVSPSHSTSSDVPVTLRRQRFPRSVSPVPTAEKPPRPASLQLQTRRKNDNDYVDDPSTRRSVHFSPTEWSSITFAVGREGSPLPEICISLPSETKSSKA